MEGENKKNNNVSIEKYDKVQEENIRFSMFVLDGAFSCSALLSVENPDTQNLQCPLVVVS